MLDWGIAMNLRRYTLAALSVLPLCVPFGATAQPADDSKWGKPLDLKNFVPPPPPIVPLPRNYQLSTGVAGRGTQQTYDAPMTNPNAPAMQSGAGIKLSIPTR